MNQVQYRNRLIFGVIIQIIFTFVLKFSWLIVFNQTLSFFEGYGIISLVVIIVVLVPMFFNSDPQPNE